MISLPRAAQTLHDRFGNVSREPYVPGKTRFRDTLCEALGISALEAEQLCDSLERSRVLDFGRSDEEGPTWTIDPSLARA
jgi:hypothetical protein